MVNVHRPLTAVVELKDVPVAVVPPPGAQLPVPAAGQRVEEVRVLHANHAEEVLVAQVAAEVVLFRQAGHAFRLQQPVVEGRDPHGLQVQQHHTTVEARLAVGRRVAHSRLGVLLAVLPEGVPGREKTRRNWKGSNYTGMTGI